MAILLVSDAPQDTLAQYDQVIARLEAAGHGRPPGRRSHTAARKGDGYLVVDVWESQEALDRFLEVLLPALQEVGSTSPPPQVYPVHNTIEGA